MKKAIKIFCWILGGLCLFLFLFIRFAERQLVKQIPDIINSVSNSNIALSVGAVKQGNCWIQLCFDLKNLTIHPQNYNPIEFKTISLRIPPIWPIRADIQALNSEKWHIDGTFSKKQWDIRSFKGSIENLDFDLSGNINTKDETGQMLLKTRGLKDFLTKFMDIPKWLSLFIQDVPQEFTLKPKDGALWLEGIPILWFDRIK